MSDTLRAMRPTRDTLNDVMSFEHVIRVHRDGAVTAMPATYAPELLDGDLDSPEWQLLDGYSGQDGYPGPEMHPSEYIGGRMADHILSTPGIYVAILASHSCDECPEEEDMRETCEFCDGNGTESDGWAVAFIAD